MRTRHLAGLTLALTIGAATVGAAQSTTPADPTPGQAAVAPSQAPGTTQDGTQDGARAGQRHWRHHSHLLRGVNLTADERTKLSAIREQYRTQLRPLMHQIRTARHTMRTASAKADTAAVSAARATMRDVRSKFAAARTQMRADVRGVLTPDQQAQFDKNVARMQSREAARANRANTKS